MGGVVHIYIHDHPTTLIYTTAHHKAVHSIRTTYIITTVYDDIIYFPISSIYRISSCIAAVYLYGGSYTYIYICMVLDIERASPLDLQLPPCI